MPSCVEPWKRRGKNTKLYANTSDWRKNRNSECVPHPIAEPQRLFLSSLVQRLDFIVPFCSSINDDDDVANILTGNFFGLLPLFLCFPCVETRRIGKREGEISTVAFFSSSFCRQSFWFHLFACVCVCRRISVPYFFITWCWWNQFLLSMPRPLFPSLAPSSWWTIT